MGSSRREALLLPPHCGARHPLWLWLLQHVCSESDTFDEATRRVTPRTVVGGCCFLATRRPHQKCYSRCRGVAKVETYTLTFHGNQIKYWFPCSVGMQIMTFATPPDREWHFCGGMLWHPFFAMLFYLFIYLSIYILIYLSIYLFIYLLLYTLYYKYIIV